MAPGRRRRQEGLAYGILLCGAWMISNATLVVAQSAYADMVCMPGGGCIEGKVDSKAGVQISLASPSINSTLPTSALLLPGSYSSATLTLGNNNASLLSTFLQSPSTTLKSYTGFDGSSSSSSTANTVDIEQTTGLLVYSSSLFSGTTALLAMNNSFVSNATSSFTPLSFITSNDIYAVAEIPTSNGDKSERVVFWNSVPDTNELPLEITNGAWTITHLESSKCTSPCSSGGICTQNGKCLCMEGFTGDTCDQCQSGHFGPDCSPCGSCNDGTCEGGITGTGRCVPRPITPAAQACNCVNGLCAAGSSDCLCSPGWADTIGGQQCSICATGYYASADGECLTCGSGCTACAASTGACSVCQPGLQISRDQPRVCTGQTFFSANSSAFESCPPRTYLANAAEQACAPCSTACESCFGPDANQCLSCERTRGLLGNTCVAVDAATGICDNSAFDSGTSAAWVLNPAFAVCDPLPPGCTAGNYPQALTVISRANVQCSACLDGLVLEGGRCKESCSDGTFAVNSPEGRTCQACSPGCTTCEGSANFCLSCPSGQILVNGSCLAASACPSGFFQPNSTAPCLACHPDCSTCAGTFDTCSTCPAGRPVLTSSKTCVLTCSASEYLDASSGTCAKCDSSCASCNAAGSGKCLSCPNTSVLKAGACVPSKCDNMTSYGVCLQDLAIAQSKSTLQQPSESKAKLPTWVYIVIVVGVLGLLLLMLLLWRMRAIRQRMDKTKGFQEKRSLFGFLPWKKKPSSAEKSSKSISMHQHDQTNTNIPRSATPPSYDFATAPVSRDMYKPPVPLAPSPSIYSFPRGPESQFWMQESKDHTMSTDNDRSSGLSFEWPPVRVMPRKAEVVSTGSFRPLLLQGSGSAGSQGSRSTFSSSKRSGTIDLTKQIELQERQKAFSKLTGGSSDV